MGIIEKLFGGKKKKSAAPRVPTWDEVVENMYGKEMSHVDEVVEVEYSLDKSKRYIVLKSDVGHYTYQLERLIAYDEDELNYFASVGDLGFWLPDSDGSIHFFDSAEHALSEMRQEPEYKAYFVSDSELADE